MGTMVLSLDLVAARSEVARALDALREFGIREDLPPQVSFDLCLAADEALANIILHGYGEDSISPIRLDARVSGETLILEVEDSGPAFDPLKAPPPKLNVPPEERKPGGLGIFLIRSVTHEVEYRRDGDRNRLTLRWRMERH
jgi:anti-sigma regulatory factor (Ser/Thr protein kinase)